MSRGMTRSCPLARLSRRKSAKGGGSLSSSNSKEGPALISKCAPCSPTCLKSEVLEVMVDAGDASCDAIFDLPRTNLFKAWIVTPSLSSLLSSLLASFVWSHNANLSALVNHHYCDDHDDHAAKSRRVQLGICRRPPWRAMQCFHHRANVPFSVENEFHVLCVPIFYVTT